MEKYEPYHHGILGQKWGVRRFQNEDGSLTPAGERRYDKQVNRAAKAALRSRAVRKALKEGQEVTIVSRSGKHPSFILGADGIKNVQSSETKTNHSGNERSSSPKKTSVSSEKSSENRKKTITKGRAIVNGVLRQTGLLAATGVGSLAASKLGHSTVATYATTTVLGLGTVANAGYTIARTVRAGKS